MNNVTLRNREMTVERYRLRLRLKFLEAIIPSKPKSFWVSLEVRTSFPLIFTSPD